MTERIRYETFANIADKSELGSLATGVISCIAEAFGQVMPEDEVDDAVRGTIVVAFAQDESVVGFASLNSKPVKDFPHHALSEYDPEMIGYSLGAGTVSKNYQGLGIYREMNRLRLNDIVSAKSAFIATTTQNPRVERGIGRVLEEYIQEGKLSTYEIYRQALKEFYGRKLTGYPIETTNTPFEELNIEAGDAFALLFKLFYDSKLSLNEE